MLLTPYPLSEEGWNKSKVFAGKCEEAREHLQFVPYPLYLSHTHTDPHRRIAPSLCTPFIRTNAAFHSPGEARPHPLGCRHQSRARSLRGSVRIFCCLVRGVSHAPGLQPRPSGTRVRVG